MRGRERPTAVVFQSADWRSGDSRMTGAGFMVPTKISLAKARAVRFFARRSAHTAPCFWAGDSQFPPYPRSAMHPRHGAQRKTSCPSLSSESRNRWPFGAA